MPACVYTPSGLAEFTKCRRVFDFPEVGDVVFFHFSTKIADPFSMPHAGIVTAVDSWKKSRTFTTVEGGVENSVQQLTRFEDDAIAFARPIVKGRPAIRTSKMQTGHVYVNSEKIRPGRQSADVLNVQLALNKVLDGVSLTPNGDFDDRTLRAIARWQRLTGHVARDADGVPSPACLRLLGEISGVFTATGLPSEEKMQTGQ
jgi:hypothetical protein